MTSWEEKARKQAQQVALRTREAIEFARNNILKSQEQQAEQANQHQRPPDFDIGNHIVVIKKSAETTTRPSDKLSFPVTQQHYKIIKKVNEGRAYRLKVPDS
jgi:DNA-nicking Smr family endonuclease